MGHSEMVGKMAHLHKVLLAFTLVGCSGELLELTQPRLARGSRLVERVTVGRYAVEDAPELGVPPRQAYLRHELLLEQALQLRV